MRTLLLVEDDQNILETMAMLLATEDYDCLFAGDIIQACELIDLNVIDLALVDFLLCGQSCLPLLKVLDDKEIPYIIVTAMRKSEIASQIPNAIDCICKPFNIEYLLSSIAKYLNLKSIN